MTMTEIIDELAVAAEAWRAASLATAYQQTLEAASAESVALDAYTSALAAARREATA